MGWETPATAHEVGRDGYDPLAPPVGPADGYDQLVGGTHTLGGANFEAGQATGAIQTRLRFNSSGTASARMIIAPATTSVGALAALDHERRRTFASEWGAVASDWRSWLSTAVLPDTTDRAVLDDAIRALITMRLAIDPDSGAIVASAHTQAPPGNWPMMVYGDGQPGGPIPYEIDETGFGAWTLYDHAQYLPRHQALAYLTAVYPAIARAADWLTACADPTNGLQCQANEDDSFTPSQTLHGAGPALLGLRSAIAAAQLLGDQSAQVLTWRRREATLGSAIDALYDPSQQAYREQPSASTALPVLYTDGGWLLWPVQLHPRTDPRMSGEASAVWSSMLASLASNSGGYEGKALLGVCETDNPATLAQHRSMQHVLHEFATQLTTDTGLFGEFWQRFPSGGPIRPLNDIPHVWESALFYLSSVCIDGGRQG
ncbi:MAG: hypothetical protein ACYDAQ_01690 [Mycobacteriales bacterium]